MLATVKTSMHSFLGITSHGQVLLKFPEKYSGPEDYISQPIADPHAKPILNFLVWVTGADLSKLTSCQQDFFV